MTWLIVAIGLIMNSNLEKIDSLELFPAEELEVIIYRLPSGEKVIVFEDCTGRQPIIYKWCLDMANEWLKDKL